MARIALDIDSTLHHYWDLLQRIARERYGVELPYEEQRDWGITVLERDAIVHCVEETHSDENIAAGVPYPDAVQTVSEWHAQGHWIHVTSHRRRSTYEATAAWLDSIGMPWDDLHCSFDKVPRCAELGIHVLVDDSPVNITKARRLIDLWLATDRAGNEHALARRMGIQEIIWNCHSWWSGSEGMDKYSACYTERGRLRKNVNYTEAHKDHIHIGLSWAGARKRTSFWAAR